MDLGSGTADEALLRAFDLGMDDDGWTEAVMEVADRLLPVLMDASYARINTSNEQWYTWSFTEAGVTRHDVLLGADKNLSLNGGEERDISDTARR